MDRPQRSPTQNEPPAVSVVMPCYNLGAYVHEAVDSVFAQTRPDFEIIIVNDGSTDAETNRILEELQRPRTTVLTTENRGLQAARNLAIQHSCGKYVCALDADDKLHPQFFEKTLAILDADPSVSFVSTWVECFGIESWTWRQHRCDFPKLLAECVVLTASPVRREALAAVGEYDADPNLYGAEDWDVWISLVERGLRGVMVPEVLFYYRQRHGSMRRLAGAGPVRRRAWQTLLEKHRASYVRFLPEVLFFKEEECGQLLVEQPNPRAGLEDTARAPACGTTEPSSTESAHRRLAGRGSADSLRSGVVARREHRGATTSGGCSRRDCGAAIVEELAAHRPQFAAATTSGWPHDSGSRRSRRATS